MIYADNAATTKLDPDALQAMLPWLQDEYANASQPYALARKPRKALAEARESIASCIGAMPEEIYFTSGGTESDNWAIKGMARRGATIFTSQIEHHAILHACAAAERMGATVRYLPVEPTGIVAPETLQAYTMTEPPSLVSVMLVNNEIGTIEPVQKLADIAHAAGAVFHTDGVQAVGHLSIDVQALGVDMLSASAHKFHGPKGIGFLYVRKGTRLSAFMDGGAQEMGMRAGTENVASIVGMAVAMQKSCAEMTETTARLRKLEERFLDILTGASIDYVRNGGTDRVPGNINISIKGASGEMLLHRLDLKGIAISTGSACDSVNTQVSHVIGAIGVDPAYASGTIRISFGRENTVDEAAAVAEALVQIVSRRK